MTTKAKIKIKDNIEFRAKIDDLYEKTSQTDLAKWALYMAKHVLDFAQIDYNKIDEIVNGFMVNELWQTGHARMHDVRQAGFNIHKIARERESEIEKAALRTVGQAVASGHMREHAMVASDYAVKTIGLMSADDESAITAERQWQLNALKKFSQPQVE